MDARKNKKLSVSLGIAFGALAVLGVISACNSGEAKEKPNFVHKEAPKPGVVAMINGQMITEDDLIGDDKLDFFELKKREYDLKMDRLNKLVVEKLVGEDAKKAGMSTTDYIDKKIAGGDLKISDKEFKKFVADKHIPETQINPQIKERIINYLQSSKKQELVNTYVAKMTKKNPVEVYFDKPKIQVAVDAGDAPWFGGKDASVTIVEFSDFQCPFCSRAAETVHELKKKYGDKIRLAYKMFPLPMHKDARPAANAALCMNDQGMDKFWKMHDLMFKNQQELNTANYEKWAKEAGGDSAKFKECMDGKKFDSRVQAEMDYGEKIGVKSTPTFFVNGQLLSGALPLDNFSEVIDDELEAKKSKKD